MTKDDVTKLNDYARERFELDGYHDSLVIGFKGEQKYLLPMDGRTKDILQLAIKTLARQLELDGLVMISECWMHRTDNVKDHVTKQLMDGEIAVSELNPEDRTEVLILHAESKEGWTMSIINEIVRDNEGKVSLKTAYSPDECQGNWWTILSWFEPPGVLCPDEVKESLEPLESLSSFLQMSSPRSPSMEKIQDDMALALFGRPRSSSINQQVCVVCGQPAMTFEDNISEKEYTISGLCQTCQNKTFKEDEE